MWVEFLLPLLLSVMFVELKVGIFAILFTFLPGPCCSNTLPSKPGSWLSVRGRPGRDRPRVFSRVQDAVRLGQTWSLCWSAGRRPGQWVESWPEPHPQVSQAAGRRRLCGARGWGMSSLACSVLLVSVHGHKCLSVYPGLLTLINQHRYFSVYSLAPF